MTAAYDSEIFEKIFSRFGFDQTVPMWKLIVVMLLRLVVSRHSIIITSGQRLHNVFFPFYFPFPNRRFFFQNPEIFNLLYEYQVYGYHDCQKFSPFGYII